MTNIYVLEGFDENSGQADLLYGPITAIADNSGRGVSSWAIATNTSYNRGSGKSVVMSNTNSSSAFNFATGGPYLWGFISRSLSQSFGTITVGAAVANLQATNTWGIQFGLMDGTTAQVGLYIDNIGNVSLVRGTIFGSVTYISQNFASVTPGRLNYFEIQATIASGTGGSCKVWINAAPGAAPALNLTSINTSATGNASVNNFFVGVLGTSGTSTIGGSPPPIGTNIFALDDLYVADTQLGSMHVQTVFPSADGTYTQWTPNSGNTHYTQVSNTSFQNTTYVMANTINLIDTYRWNGVWPGGIPNNIIAITTSLTGYATAGVGQIAPVIYDNGVLTTGNTAVIDGNGYAYKNTIWFTDPGRSNTSWSTANVANLEFGIQRIS